MRLAIVGAGSLGTIIGALITRGGADPLLVDVNNEHVRVLNDRGATVTGKIELTVPVKAVAPEGMTGTYDVVLYAVKQYDNGTALAQLSPRLGPRSMVCTLQNGLPEEAVARAIGRERTVGCTVGWGATWMVPGVSMLTSPPETMGFNVGELDGAITERLTALAGVLSLVCPTAMTNDLAGIRWTKLVANAAYSGTASALGCTMGEVLDNQKALLCAAHIANETISVSRALGVVMGPMASKDLGGLAFRDHGELAAALELHHEIWGSQRALKPSMLQDLEKGRRCEIDAINGAAPLAGRRIGVATPVNDQIVAIVRGIESGLHRWGFKTSGENCHAGRRLRYRAKKISHIGFLQPSGKTVRNRLFSSNPKIGTLSRTGIGALPASRGLLRQSVALKERRVAHEFDAVRILRALTHFEPAPAVRGPERTTHCSA